MKNFIKNNKNYVLAVILPIVIMLIVYIFNHIYPFGDNIVAMGDGYNQYPGMLNNFLNILKGKENLFYTFKGLLGFNTYATLVYYTFNITNIFGLLFSNVMQFYNFIVIFKIMLCSLTMFIYLNYVRKRKINYLFSICYALSTYNLLYYFNYMWFDSIILLPIVMMGIEKIFKEDSYLLYVVNLSCTIIFNFYIGYMICIFSVIYFIYKSIIKGFNKSRIFKYLFYSLLSGLISAFALVPVVLELLNGKAELISEFAKDYFKFDLDGISTFYKLTFASFSNGDLEYGTPNVYVSLFVYINALLYFFNSRIKLKERLASLGVCLFFLLSVSFNLLDYFWHMMSMPIFYPVRYSFIFSFFLIYLGFRNFIRYDKKNWKFNLGFYTLFVVMIGIGFVTSGNLDIDERQNLMAKLIYLGISFVFMFYYIFMLNHKEFKKYIVYVVIIELGFNAFLTFKNSANESTYSKFINNYNFSNESISKIEDNDLYRTGFYDRTILNNGLLHEYNEVSYFSSVRNSNVFKYAKNVLGITVSDNCSSKYYYNNPIVNSLLGIKYIISNQDVDYYKEYKDNIYLNEDATSFGFLTTNKILELKYNDDFVSNMNNLVKTINNNDKNIIKEIDAGNKTISCNKKKNFCIFNGDDNYVLYQYMAKNDEFIFLNNDNYSKNEYEFYLNDNITEIQNKGFLLLHSGDKIKFKITVDKKSYDYNIHLYSINYNVYKEFVNNINNKKMIVNNYYDDHHFTAKVNVKDDTLLYTSIANDKGWKIYVDGTLTNPASIYDAVIGLDLTEGEHLIEFKYFTPGLIEGLVISGTSILTGLIILFIKRTKK